MSILEAIILGVIQGLTEFLPISSSGHLVLSQSLLGINQPGNEFEVLVHIGTLMSVFVIFKKDIIKLLTSLSSKSTQLFLIYIIIGSFPAAFIGLGFKDILESFFDNMFVVSISLIFTGLILYSTSIIKRKQNKDLILFNSIFIGVAQAIAIIPGISRSGMTISIALLLGISPKIAAKYSFLLAIPVISGAGLLTALDNSSSTQIFSVNSFAGMITAFLVGVIALKWLLRMLERGKLHYFGIYCISIGLVSFLYHGYS